MASWACSMCTFLNPPSQKSTCQVCLNPSSVLTLQPSSSSLSPRRWSCKACTFLNTIFDYSCRVCGTRSNMTGSSSSVPDELGSNQLLDSSVGSVFLPLRKCSNKRGAENAAEGAAAEGAAAATDGIAMGRPEKMVRKEDLEVIGTKQNTIKILSYNVWFREDLEVYKRMKSLGDLIQQNSPDCVFLQEVTPNIYNIFQKANWWNEYICSVSPQVAIERPYFCMQMSKLPVKEFSIKPFQNSIMGRELCIADVGTGMGKSLILATSHLESPCPAPPRWDQMYVQERVDQAKESISFLKDSPNVIFGGDMNWDDKLDGSFPLKEGWVDPWLELHPNEKGFTYDTKSNKMLSGNRTLQKRLDRIVCKLQDFKVTSISMVGQEAIPDLSYVKEKKVKNQIQKLVLPVLTSDHYGLLLTIHNL